MYRIMLVDDEPNVLEGLRRVLRVENYQCLGFTDPRAALDTARNTEVDLVVSDYCMPEMDGVQFLVQFKQLQPDAMRIMLSGRAGNEALIKAVNKGEIYRFILKPVDPAEIKSTLAQALTHREQQLENQRLADQARRKGDLINQKDSLLARLEMTYPGITDANAEPEEKI